MVDRDMDAHISQEHVETLVRVAGIRVAVERLPSLTREFAAAMRAASQLDDAARRAHVQGGESFDPAWPTGRKEGRS